MTALAATGSMWDAIASKPTQSVLALAALAVVTAVAALGLRAATRRIRSLRAQVLAIALVGLAIGAAAAVLAARLMIIDGSDLPRVGAVLVVTALIATVLVVVSTAPLGRDVRRLEDTVRQVEAGSRDARTGVDRSDELGHVATALDELVARLDQLESEREGVEAERRTMLSSVGHDLRTPLAALRVSVEALADGVAPDPDRYLRSMQRDVEALSALVDDFFLLARIEAGRLDEVSIAVDLREVADEAIDALAPVASDRGVALTLDAAGAVRVSGNPTALGRVVRNLLDNAIRHAPPGSVVHVVVAADARPMVRVVDEGPGFPPGFVDEAFGTFTRSDASRTRSTGGAGLGLAIARGLVEAHGGRIWIEDTAGGHVAFELPEAASA